MFDSVTARYVLRGILFGLSGFVVSLQASSTGSDLEPTEWRNAILAGIVAALAYYGIGAAVPAVEPNVGNKMDDQG